MLFGNELLIMDSNWTLKAIDEDDLKQLIKKINTLKAIDT
jgi:BRCT domain type II-containing protein